MHPMSLKKTALAFTLASCALSAHATDPELQKQIDELTSKIAELESKTESNSESISSLIGKEMKEAITINGFASFGVSQFSKTGMDEEQFDEKYYYGQSTKLSVLPNTWFGLQMNAKLYDGGNIVAQIASKGTSDEAFKIDMEWLFFKQDLGAGFSTQLGRIRFPAFIDSEVVYIGNTYPTVAPPAEIYSVLPIFHIDGASISHSIPINDWTLDTKVVLWGESSKDYDGYTLSLKRIRGLAFAASDDTLTLRLAAFRAEENIDITMPPFTTSFGDDLTYITSAIRYDDQQFYVSAEGIVINTEEDKLDENRNWNITTGYYVGPVLMYVGHSRTMVSNDDDLSDELTEYFNSAYAGNLFAANLNRQQNTTMTGIKYNFTNNASLKVQVQHVGNFDDTPGNFSTQVQPPAVSFEHLYIYDIAVQTSF